MTRPLTEAQRRALEDYQGLIDIYPNLFHQRARRRLVLNLRELEKYVAEHDELLGVAVTSPYVYFLIDLVESRGPDGTAIRYPYLRVIFRRQLLGGFNVVIVATIADASLGRIGDIVVVQQERHATGAVEFELPRGFAEAGLSMLDNALKELREETGYIGDDAIELGMTVTDSGIMDAQVHYLHVPVFRRIDAAPEVREAIIGVQVMSPDEIWSAVRVGRIRDGFTLQAMALWGKFGVKADND